MGTLNWTVSGYSTDSNKNLVGSRQRFSNTSTTALTAGNIASLTVSAGDVFVGYASEDMWVNFGGRSAAVGTGHFFPAGLQTYIEISPGDDGAVSVIDVA